MRIRVCMAGTDRVLERWVELPDGASAAEAMRASGLVPADWQGSLGVHGAVVPFDRTLQPGDRLELYRSLPTDPRTRRRQRALRRR